MPVGPRPSDDALLLLAALRRKGTYRRLANRLAPELFPGDLTILREALEKYHEKRGQEIAPIQALAVVARRLAGKRWELVEQLVARWARMEIPADRVVEEHLEEYVRREGLRRLSLEIAGGLDQGEEPDPEAVRNRLSALIFTFDTSTDRTLDYVSADRQYFAQLRKGRIPTGVEEVDRLLDGGPGPGEVAVFLAPYGEGKSSWLTAVGGHAVSMGKRVLHISLELHKLMCLLRYDQHFSGKTKEELRKNPKLIDQNRRRVKKAGGRLCLVDLSHEWVAISQIDSLIERHGPFDLVVVDYAQLLKSRRAYENRRFEIGLVYQELRQLASYQNIPIWTAHQATREAKKKEEFTGADAGEDISTMQTSDHVVCIRPSTLWMDKNRIGESKVIIPVAMEFAIMRPKRMLEGGIHATSDSDHRRASSTRQEDPGVPNRARALRPRSGGSDSEVHRKGGVRVGHRNRGTQRQRSSARPVRAVAHRRRNPDR